MANVTGLRVAVVGAGAIGGSVAADLAAEGRCVTVIDAWPSHIERIRAEGLKVQTAGDWLTARPEALHVGDLATLTQAFDVVFLGVKAYDTAWAAELVKRYLKPHGQCVGLQNSIRDAHIARALGSDRTVGCVVELAGEIVEPGVILRRSSRSNTWFGIGAEGGNVEQLPRIAELLSAAGKVALVASIKEAKWTKLVVNAALLGPLGVLGMTIAEALGQRGMKEFIHELAREAVEVMNAAGYRMQPVFGLEPRDMEGPSETVVKRLIETLLLHTGHHAKTAVLQDFVKGRYSEVDEINGLVVETGREVGVETISNQRVVGLAREISANTTKPGPHHLPALLGL